MPHRVLDLTADAAAYDATVARLRLLHGVTVDAAYRERLCGDGRFVRVDKTRFPLATSGPALRAFLWALYFHENPDRWGALAAYTHVGDRSGVYAVGAEGGYTADATAAILAGLAGGVPLPEPFAALFARVTGRSGLPPPTRLAEGRANDGDGMQGMPGPRVSAILGEDVDGAQYGILGRTPEGAPIGLDLGGANTIGVFGVQGSGKTNTTATVLEMALMPIPGINRLPRPLAGVVYHYSGSEEILPEYAAMDEPADRAVDILRRLYRAEPRGLADIVVLVPEGSLERRRAEFPRHAVRPILFRPGELDQRAWRLLMDAPSSATLYMKTLTAAMERCGAGLSLGTLAASLAGAGFTTAGRQMAETRLAFAAKYVREDAAPLGDVVRPGRLVIVDLRDPWLDKTDALALIMVLMRLFTGAGRSRGRDDGPFNQMHVLDEAHRYMRSALSADIIETFRDVRHRRLQVVVASQDPLSVPRQVIDLASQVVLHRCDAPDWLRHIARSNVAMRHVSSQEVAALGVGEAIVISRQASHPSAAGRPFRVCIRPRVTMHGGHTLRVA